MADNEQIPPAPPPPPPPIDEGGLEEDYLPEDDGGSLDTGRTAVASGAKKNLVVMLIGGALLLFLIYQLFFSGDDNNVPPPPIISNSSQGADVAPSSSAPILAETVLPPPPPPPPPPPDDDIFTDLPPPPPPEPDIDFEGQGPTNEQLQARRQSEMLILNNAQTPPEDSGNQTGTMPIDGSDRNSAFAQAAATSSAARAQATYVGDLNNLVLQGKVVDAVLETAIDTTLPGPLRAIVSRDVYAEAGSHVLIPKGSRIIGTYNTDVVRGQGRVFIIWSRLIRPDGIDVEIGSQAIDRLGKSGIVGFVDDRYFEVFGGAILTSILSITFAGIADAILDPEASTETQNTDGSTTSTGSAVDSSITESVGRIGQVSQAVVGGLLDARPSISVDQGTPIKIFVNRDLEFSDSLTNRVRIIQ